MVAEPLTDNAPQEWAGALVLPQMDFHAARPSTNPVTVYLAGLDSPRSRATMRGYLRQLTQMATGDASLPPEAVPWHQMRYAHVAALRSALSARGYAPKTANTTLTALRGVLKACWRLGLMSAEDYHTAGSIESVTGERLPAGREITAGERAALFVACARDTSPVGRRDAALVALLYGCGMRRAEVAALDVDDYDREQGRLRVLGKRNKERFVYVSASGVGEALDDWLAARAEAGLSPERGPLFVRAWRGGHILPPMLGCDDSDAERLSPSGIYAVLNGRAAEAGVPKLSPHDFRRTFIGDLLDAGVDLVVVSKMAGHSQVQTTARYDRRPETAKRKAAETLHVPYVRRAG